MKYFIITVDTEGDNLWKYKKGQEVQTENTQYIPRFQNLCEKYGFKPVWLTNYEMVCDQRYVDYIKPKMEAGLCEVGIHVHAWNNPPLYILDAKYSGNPYLIEYPDEVMKSKFEATYNLIKEKFGINVKSHRAGRWAMDNRYFSLLRDFKIDVDCSFTPGISWHNVPGETCMGSDYSNIAYYSSNINGVLEVPMTIRKMRRVYHGSVKHKIKALLQGEYIWLRPATSSLKDMISLCDIVDKEGNNDYLEFMLHSSELMPGGSPYFPDEESINLLYNNLDCLFEYVWKLGYIGITLEDYCINCRNNK